MFVFFVDARQDNWYNSTVIIIILKNYYVV